MTLADIASSRLANQQLNQKRFSHPKDLLTWLGAVQAQDYAGSFWAIAQRLTGATEAAIENAIENKEIIRTWPMRGTLHFVAATDAHWMLSLLAPRVLQRTAGIYQKAGLDETVFKKSRKIITKALEDNQQLTRTELYERLEKAGIVTTSQRGLHILGYLAQQGLICLGPHIGKQPCFVLLDDWVSPSKQLKNEEAMAILAERYFLSHGPATIQDFAWWSGLTIAEAKSGIESIKERLQAETVNHQVYWMDRETCLDKMPSSIYLLPSYDEYLVAYKDRTAAFDQKYLDQIVKSGNGIFSPVIIARGRVVGTWKRSFVKNKVVVEVWPFSALTKSQTEGLRKAAKLYGSFLNKEIAIQS